MPAMQLGFGGTIGSDILTGGDVYAAFAPWEAVAIKIWEVELDMRFGVNGSEPTMQGYCMVGIAGTVLPPGIVGTDDPLIPYQYRFAPAGNLWLPIKAKHRWRVGSEVIFPAATSPPTEALDGPHIDVHQGCAMGDGSNATFGGQVTVWYDLMS